jgi:hypothetical protein
MDRRTFSARVLPWFVAKKNKTKFKILTAPRGDREECSHLHEYPSCRPRPDSCLTNIRHQGAAFYPEVRRAAVPKVVRTSGVSIPVNALSNLGDISPRQPHLDQEFLIANPRLEFTATPTKQGTAAKSNRKYFAIFHPRFFFPQVASSESPVTDFLIDTPRLAFRITRTKQSALVDSNRYKNGLLFPTQPTLESGSLATNHKSRITSHAAFRSTIPREQNAHR